MIHVVCGGACDESGWRVYVFACLLVVCEDVNVGNLSVTLGVQTKSSVSVVVFYVIWLRACMRAYASLVVRVRKYLCHCLETPWEEFHAGG